MRSTPQDGFDVNCVGSGHAQWGDDFEFPDQFGDFTGAFGLNRADDNILSAFLSPPAFVEHAQRFAYARRVSKKDLEAAASIVFFLRRNLAQ
jgi:hypothetical protein